MDQPRPVCRTTPHQLDVAVIELHPWEKPLPMPVMTTKEPKRNAWRAMDVLMGTDGPRPQTKNKRRRGRPHKRKR